MENPTIAELTTQAYKICQDLNFEVKRINVRSELKVQQESEDNSEFNSNLTITVYFKLDPLSESDEFIYVDVDGRSSMFSYESLFKKLEAEIMETKFLDDDVYRSKEERFNLEYARSVFNDLNNLQIIEYDQSQKEMIIASLFLFMSFNKNETETQITRKAIEHATRLEKDNILKPDNVSRFIQIITKKTLEVSEK